MIVVAGSGTRKRPGARDMRLSPRLRACLPGLAGLMLGASAADVALADGYSGDFHFSDLPAQTSSAAPAPVLNTTSGVTTLTGNNDFSAVNNGAGATLINNGVTKDDLNNAGTLINTGTYTANIVGNTSTITNTQTGHWNGDLLPNANGPLGHIVNEGAWTGVLNNAGGSIDNTGTLTGDVVNTTGILTNEGTITGVVSNGGTATNSAKIQGSVTNTSNFVNNAAGSVGGDLVNAGTATNNGTIVGKVQQGGAFTNNSGAVVLGGLSNGKGATTNNGTIEGGVSASAGSVTNNGLIKGGAQVQGPAVNFSNNGTISGAVADTGASSTFNNNAKGIIAGSLTIGALTTATNSGQALAGVTNSGAFTNDATGYVAGGLVNAAGTATNNGEIDAGATLTGGTLVNNNILMGDVTASATSVMTNNKQLNGLLTNAGKYTNNAAGYITGGVSNTGSVVNNGVIVKGVTNSGDFANNAGATVGAGLVNNGGTAFNGGVINGGATVTSGTLTTIGTVNGGVTDKSIVNATGTISGAIVNTGAFNVGDGTTTLGEKLTVTAGSSIKGLVNIPVDLATGRSNFLSAKGVDVSGATVNLGGVLANPKRAYFGAIQFSDTTIAIDSSVYKSLKSISDLLYAYSISNGDAVTQTINPGLAATAGNQASALLTAINSSFFTDPSPFLRAPVDPTPNLFYGDVWARSAVSSSTIGSLSTAGAAPSFNAASMNVRLAGAQFGLDGGLFNIQNSGMSAHFGFTGGEIAASSSDANLPGATARTKIPFGGIYATLGGNGFFGALQARYGRFDMVLNDPALAVFNQSQRAAGMTYSAEAGYNIPLGDGMFIEPSAGFYASRMKVDGQTTNLGTLTFGALNSDLGRFSLRAGADYQLGRFAVQPYVVGGVWHEFRGGVTTSIPNGPTINQSSLGTFEQVGLGFSATIAKLGLTVYAQGDGRFGPNMRGFGATAGLKYTF